MKPFAVRWCAGALALALMLGGCQGQADPAEAAPADELTAGQESPEPPAQEASEPSPAPEEEPEPTLAEEEPPLPEAQDTAAPAQPALEEAPAQPEPQPSAQAAGSGESAAGGEGTSSQQAAGATAWLAFAMSGYGAHVGDSFYLQLTVYTEETDPAVSFSSSRPGVASVAADGLIQCLAPGETVITATLANGAFSQCTVTVEARQALAEVATVFLNEFELTLQVGDRFTLEATCQPEDRPADEIQWSMSNQGVLSLSADGTITALKEGKCTVYATHIYSGQSASCEVEVEPGPAPGSQSGHSGISSFAAEVARLTNAYRESQGLAALSYSLQLQQAANVRAVETVEKFSHTRPDGSDCFTIFTEFSLPFSSMGENLASGQMTPEQVVQDWINSPSHRETMLQSAFTQIGVGFYDNDGEYYWVQLFGG